MHYNPDPRDQPQFVFFPDVSDTFNISENRTANIYGAKVDYTVRPDDHLDVKIGTQSSITSGHEDFSAFNANGTLGPQSNSDLNGHDLGLYAQTAYTPLEWIELRTGLRWDQHQAPAIAAQSQLSPRVRLNFYPSTSTTLYGYYGRLFMPTNIEDLRAITQAAQGGEADQGTVPERDDFFEVGAIQRFPDAGMVTKLSHYHKSSNPGIDDNTVPGSNIVTDVNIEHVRIAGLEGVVEIQTERPGERLSERGAQPRVRLRSDHRRILPRPSRRPERSISTTISVCRSSAVGRIRRTAFYLSGTAIYGSGLTNGVEPDDLRLLSAGRACSISTAASMWRRARSSTRQRGYAIILGKSRSRT